MVDRQDGAGGGGAAVSVLHRIEPRDGITVAALREILGSRDLFMLLVHRELQVRYRQTLLGIVWVVLQPLVPALIFAAIFGVLARLPSGAMPYAVFAMSGMTVYTYIAGAVSRSGSSFLTDGRLLTKVYFPRVLLPAASATAAVVDFFVGLVVLIVLMLIFGEPVAGTVVLVPLVAIAALIFAVGTGSAVAALSAFYRDFSYAVPFLLQVLLYVSPVLYSVELVPQEFLGLYSLNPLVALVESFRWAVFGSTALAPIYIMEGLIVGAVVAVGGIGVFARLERTMSDVL